jgi:hypothetical protein
MFKDPKVLTAAIMSMLTEFGLSWTAIKAMGKLFPACTIGGKIGNVVAGYAIAMLAKAKIGSSDEYERCVDATGDFVEMTLDKLGVDYG